MKKAISIIILLILSSSVGCIKNTEISSSEEQKQQEFGTLNDLEISLRKDTLCIDRVKNTDKIRISIYNPTNKTIPVANTTLAIYVDDNIKNDTEIVIPIPYGKLFYRTPLPLKYYYEIYTIAPDAYVEIGMRISINFDKRPYHKEYTNNYIMIGDRRLNFTILTYNPPYRYIIDPNDFIISFNNVFDFSDIVAWNDSVIRNKTITHTLTIYNPTCWNATGLLLSLKELDEYLENDKFIVKVGDTFLYWEYITGYYHDYRYNIDMPIYHIYENMTLDVIPSLGKLEIPVSISFVKCPDGWIPDGCIFDCALLLYSGEKYIEIPFEVRT